MQAQVRSQFTAAVAGGVIVAAVFLALGITGRRTTRTVVQQSPIASETVSDASLTPHAIYVRDAPGVVFVKAEVARSATDPFGLVQMKERSASTGSGFLITTAGYILTNFHLVEGADRQTGVIVDFENDVERRARVVGEDESDDLALLKVDMSGVPHVTPLVLGDSTSVRVGDPTLAIGNPFGSDRTLTSGIVSALQRQLTASNGFAIDNVIQTDVPVNLGNSGGPLLDADGRVIGIDSQLATGSGRGSVGVAFAVPVDTAKAFIARRGLTS